MIGAAAPLVDTCSRAGCTNPATAKVHWRNPRIHSVDRVKVWLACDDHTEFLHDYLQTRGFPVLATSLDQAVDSVPS